MAQDIWQRRNTRSVHFMLVGKGEDGVYRRMGICGIQSSVYGVMKVMGPDLFLLV